MRFQTQMKKLTEVGFKSFIALDYFFLFSKNEGKSVRELSGDNTDEYQKALRYFKLLSDGTKTEEGMELFTTEPIIRTKVKLGRYPHVNAIQLTTKGRKLLAQLKPPIKRSLTRKVNNAQPKPATAGKRKVAQYATRNAA